MRALLSLLTLLVALSVPADARHARGCACANSGGLILPAANNVSLNWENAGVPNGIPTRGTQCGSTVMPTAASTFVTPPNTGDDVSLINAAISACTAGQYVLLGQSSTSANVSVAAGSNTLTLNSGTLAIGYVIRGASFLQGTTVTAGSGASWTISMPPGPPGTAVTNENVTAVAAFQIAQSEYINLNKGVSLRGSGSCTASSFPWCPTEINVWNGALPNWSISATTGGSNCGVTSTASSGCGETSAVILVSNNGNSNFGWAGHSTGLNTSPVGSGTTLTADAAQGATSVQVASTTNLAAGRWVLLDENPALTTTTNPVAGNASIQADANFLSSSPTPAQNIVANPDASGGDVYAWSLYPNRVNAEMHLITNVGTACGSGATSLTVCFDDPLTIAFRQSGSHAAQLYWPTNCCSSTYTALLSGAGVENLSISRGAAGGIVYSFCTGCWAKGVDVEGFISGSVTFRWSTRSQVTGSLLAQCFDCENNGTEYPLSIDAGSTEILADNNIIVYGGKGMVGRASGGGNVVAYNYVDMTAYEQQSIGDYWQEMGVNGSHYAGTHHWLFEGNLGSNCDNDETHGNAVFHTYFRNQCKGLRANFTDASNGKSVSDASGIGWGQGGVAASNGPLRAAGPMAFNYWDAYAANVLGLSGTTTTANSWVYQCKRGGSSTNNKCIWMSGWTGGEWTGTVGDANLISTATPQYIFRNGNFDYVTGGVADNASTYSQNFPSSLYLSGKPTYFTGTSNTYPWPWVTPTSSPYVQPNSAAGSGLPAKARWDAGTPFVQP